jgi:lipopolysaccharide assembly protein A
VRVFYRAILLFVAIFLILFAVSNREAVSLALWPLPFLADVPVYLLCFLSLLIGAVFGASTAWLTARRDRREFRRRRRRIEALERELALAQSQLEDRPQNLSPASPAQRQLT